MLAAVEADGPMVVPAPVCETGEERRGVFAIWGSPSLIGVVDWTNQSQVGGRTHEAQFGFVWCGGNDDAYRRDNDDALSRDAYCWRCWQLKVLRRQVG
jgi:hypothetical protein